MNCLYCDAKINKYSLKSIFLKEDELCVYCRNSLIIKRQKIKLNKLEVEAFYEYDGLFKDLLIQYKECYDEALYKVFLYDILDYLDLKYYGYKLIFVPSSKKKLEKRGFNHLELMFKDSKLKKADGLIMKEELVQEGKNRIDRLKMLNNYSYIGKPLKKVLLVDDVITTGSSIIGAYKALKPHCKKVKIVVLAYRKKTLSLLKKSDRINL